MIRIFSFIILLFAGSAFGHPLHLSITNISIEGTEIKISMKTFRDDWEVAYFHYYGKIIDFSDPQNREIQWFRDYLEKSFRVSPDPGADPLKIEYDTIIAEDQNMVIEMHTRMQEEPNSLYLCNTVLIDIFPDQTNLVIIGFRDRETGIKFDIGKHSEEVSLVTY